MKRLALLLLLATAWPAHAQGISRDFEDDPVGGEARDWASPVGRWRIAEDPSAPAGPRVLAQEAESSPRTFNLALASSGELGDLELSVELRAVSGRVDRGGGVLWRASDARNYYVARYNPLEDNFRVYFVKDGDRHLLASADVELDHGAWHTLRVRMRGDRITCELDGKRYLDLRDGTFTRAGAVGLWTKADARTHFDGFEARALGRTVDAALVARVLGVEPTADADGTLRAAWPRTDVAVTVSGMPLEPAAGLTSRAAFQAVGEATVVTCDTVLFEDEVDPAIDAALAHDLRITALHNRFLFDRPRVDSLHLGGRGDAERLAAGIQAVRDAVRAVRRARPVPATGFPGQAPVPGRLDAERIAALLGRATRTRDGVVEVSLPGPAPRDGAQAGGPPGLGTRAVFCGSDESAAVDGDMALTADEVQPVLRALRRAGLHVVSLHGPGVGEERASSCLHYWGSGPAADLARALRAVLDAQASLR